MLNIISSMMEEQKVDYNNELREQNKENIKQVLEGFELKKLKKIHKKALKKEDHEITDMIKNILIERVIKNF